MNRKETKFRTSHSSVVLIAQGILVGVFAGLIVIGYRLSLAFAGGTLQKIIAYMGHLPVLMAGWFAVLILMAFVVSRLVKFEPYIAGSGVPQMEGEIQGFFDQNWYRVLCAKFLAGFICIFGGLALGYEGPSLQLGAMAGKGVSKALHDNAIEEDVLVTCGASAGLSAAFQAPLAGAMFALEEIHKSFSPVLIVSVMASSITADFLATNICGVEPVFDFVIYQELPLFAYGLVILLGIILGVLGAFYNWFTLKCQDLYKKTNLGVFGKVLIAFMCAGVLAFTFPMVLGGGSMLIEAVSDIEFGIAAICILLVIRFLYSGICFGSGAPGGIFLPMLVIGGLIGALFAFIGTRYFGMDFIYLNNFITLAMAGYFAAIVRAPLTGIVLVFEMTGELHQMLSLCLVSIISYVVSDLLGARPIYDTLLARFLRDKLRQKRKAEKKAMGKI